MGGPAFAFLPGMQSALRHPGEPTRYAPYALLGAAACGCLTQALMWKATVGLAWFFVNLALVSAMAFVFRPKRLLATGIVALGNLVLSFSIVYYASDWSLRIAFPANLALLFLLPFVAASDDVRLLPRSLVDGLRRTPRAVTKTVRLPADALNATARDRARSLLRGTLIGLPLAVVFALLLSADPKFSRILWETLGRSGDIGQFGLFSVLTSTGYLLLYMVHRPDEAEAQAVETRPYRAHSQGHELDSRLFAPKRQGPWVRPLTWGVVLAQVAVVFGLFAAVHARELFGGHALARAAGTVTYAEYLHAGFAELLFATVLAVLTIVSGHALLRDRTKVRRQPEGSEGPHGNESIPGGRALALLEVTLLALVGIALASCWQRSSIYEIAYGYTYLRLGVRFVEAAALGVTLLTMLKASLRAWRGYGVGVAALGLASVLAASCFDADLYIARENVARAAAAKDGSGSPYAWKTLDLGYLEGLSRDALPVLRDPYFADETTMAGDLEETWRVKTPARGWRSFRGIAGR
jgi:Domain of unknown function (DUF4173)